MGVFRNENAVANAFRDTQQQEKCSRRRRAEMRIDRFEETQAVRRQER